MKFTENDQKQLWFSICYECSFNKFTSVVWIKSFCHTLYCTYLILIMIHGISQCCVQLTRNFHLFCNFQLHGEFYLIFCFGVENQTCVYGTFYVWRSLYQGEKPSFKNILFFAENQNKYFNLFCINLRWRFSLVSKFRKPLKENSLHLWILGIVYLVVFLFVDA